MPACTEPTLVALQVPPGPRFAEALTARWQAGEAVLPLAPDLPGTALRRLLAELRPARLVRPDFSEERLPHPVPVVEGTALVVVTSGSAGRPKGVELSHQALVASARAGLRRLGAAADDQWLLCLPVHHVAGILVLVRSALLGTAPVIHARFSPAAIAAAPAVTHLSLVPTMLDRLLEAGVDLARFRCLLVGGGTLPAGLVARAQNAGARVVTSYGLTETCGGCVYDGVPLDGIEAHLDALGRIAIRGPVLMRGYRRRPALSATVLRRGWLHTADLGRWTADGRLEVLGRADDVIVSGGENVDPVEVAALLLEHPLVADVAVTGRPDRRWGERVVAVCVPADRSRPPDLVELRRFVTARSAVASAPQELVVVDYLPRTALGKIDRRRLRAVAARTPSGLRTRL